MNRFQGNDTEGYDHSPSNQSYVFLKYISSLVDFELVFCSFILYVCFCGNGTYYHAYQDKMVIISIICDLIFIFHILLLLDQKFELPYLMCRIASFANMRPHV